jgi:hypothetical protein
MYRCMLASGSHRGNVAYNNFVTLAMVRWCLPSALNVLYYLG